jgi:beta-lactamase superfamily II metal-dependent hydrolase
MIPDRFSRWLSGTLLVWLLLLVPAAGMPDKAAAQTTATALRIFFIDVEGGQATLFVTPEGQSLLIDTGWPGHQGRDADRIAATAHRAGLSRIDFVVITHFHDDHVGGVPQLVERIPVGTFIDHGPNLEHDGGVTEHGYQEYQRVLAANLSRHLTLQPGDALPLPASGRTPLTAHVVSSAGRLIQKPLPGSDRAAETNPACATSPLRSPDDAAPEQIENESSLGLLLQFGALRILDLGDLTWGKERELMCPVNRIGHVGLLIVSHHGWDHSSSPALVDDLRARAAIMDNGDKKGGSPLTFQTLAAVPSHPDLWQLHFSEAAGKGLNRPEDFIANPHGEDHAHMLEVDAEPDGSFKVINRRNGFRRSYPASR